MKTNTGEEIVKYILSTLAKLKEPITTHEVLSKLLSGDEIADLLISEINYAILKVLITQNLINADEPLSQNSKIYGLTENGNKLYDLFLEITKK